jgi:hypothetical protein
MRLTSAVLIAPSGKEFDLGKPYYTGYGIGVTYAFELGKIGFTGDQFGLRLSLAWTERQRL